MGDTFQFEIVTPDRLVAADEALEMQIPGKNGYIGILPGHAPLITELDIGEITYRRDGVVEHLSVAWGFAEVLPNKVTILAETAERAEEIDVERARKALQRAEERLRSGDPNIDYARALRGVRRAQSRLQVAQKAGKVAAS